MGDPRTPSNGDAHVPAANGINVPTSDALARIIHPVRPLPPVGSTTAAGSGEADPSTAAGCSRHWREGSAWKRPTGGTPGGGDGKGSISTPPRALPAERREVG